MLKDGSTHGSHSELCTDSVYRWWSVWGKTHLHSHRFAECCYCQLFRHNKWLSVLTQYTTGIFTYTSLLGNISSLTHRLWQTFTDIFWSFTKLTNTTFWWQGIGLFVTTLWWLFQKPGFSCLFLMLQLS